MSDLFREPKPGASTMKPWSGGRTVSEAEIQLRAATEDWARKRFPTARMVHEIVVGQGEARADMAAIDVDHFAVFEIKSNQDNMARIVHQVGMFRLASAELWIVVDPDHMGCVDALRFLFPTLGVLVIQTPATGRYAWSLERIGLQPLEDGEDYRVVRVEEAQRHEPHWSSALSLLWVAELHWTASALGYGPGPKATHKTLVNLLLEAGPRERSWAICAALRNREAQWRADPPCRPGEKPSRGT